jgi:hypothetical protein
MKSVTSSVPMEASFFLHAVLSPKTLPKCLGKEMKNYSILGGIYIYTYAHIYLDKYIQR